MEDDASPAGDEVDSKMQDDLVAARNGGPDAPEIHAGFKVKFFNLAQLFGFGRSVDTGDE